MRLLFLPDGSKIEAAKNTKLLVAARRAKTAIRFGCAACQCGTCAVKVTPPALVTPMQDSERELLQQIGLETNGTIRLSCQARISTDEGKLTIDLGFQKTYSP